MAKSHKRARKQIPRPVREVDYHNLTNPFAPMDIYSADYIEQMHNAAIDILAQRGIKVLLEEARQIFQKAGAIVEGEIVRIDRELIDAALKTAPKSFTIYGGAPHKNLHMAMGKIAFQPGGGAPHATDRIKGRRPGSLSDFHDFVRINQHFDVLQMISPAVEPQDVPIHLRHYATTKAQLSLSNKIPFVFARGTPQTLQAFDMIRNARGVSAEEFQERCYCYSIINTNSPRQLDIPMAQGLIDFARAGQLLIVTPFTLMGAMAPITVAGAITLSHAEALFGIALTQLTNPGAPVCYGTFTSNVDMKSGAPAFGTPEHFQATVVAGQLARKLGLPWRSSTGSAANSNDAQGANEMQLGLWGCLLAGTSIVVHAAGWLEGGLTVSYEKIVSDCEVLQMIAELCANNPPDLDDLAHSALDEVQPGGHFFGCAHTMARYDTQFYPPFLHTRANFGTWHENGALDTDARATKVWQDIVAQPTTNYLPQDRMEQLESYIRNGTAAGGAPPVS